MRTLKRKELSRGATQVMASCEPEAFAMVFFTKD
jgi:hypothetical protein